MYIIQVWQVSCVTIKTPGLKHHHPDCCEDVTGKLLRFSSLPTKHFLSSAFAENVF